MTIEEQITAALDQEREEIAKMMERCSEVCRKAKPSEDVSELAWVGASAAFIRAAERVRARKGKR